MSPTMQDVFGFLFLAVYCGIGSVLALLFACFVVSVFGPRIR